MRTFLKNLFFSENFDSDFSDFFTRTNSEEKARVIRRALREANEEQRELVRKYTEESTSQFKRNLNKQKAPSKTLC
jgi:single-stranded DNA-specific DHH superfamily exonuclease